MESFNALINLAQAILAGGFDVQAFLNWQVVAFTALVGILGPNHYYTKNFKQFTSDPNPLALLAGEGILVAANEEMRKADDESRSGRTREHQAV